MFFGEALAIVVALSWTATALFAEVGSKRMGSLPFNSVRMAMSLFFLVLTLWLTIGVPWPRFADGPTWGWLLASGAVGYVVGDYCLMQGYILIGSRFGQLLMTLSAPSAAITALLLLGEHMRPIAVIGMCVTIIGIAISILSKEQDGESCRDETLHSKFHLNLPAKGVVYGAMAGICQGVGLVLSKVGLQHYEASIVAQGLTLDAIPTAAILPIKLGVSMSFAATMIRAIIGLAGFLLMLRLMHPDTTLQLRRALGNRRAMLCTLASTIFGPFIGVSLSLLATQYTSAGIAQTLFALTPVIIIVPSVWFFHQRVTFREVVGAIISVAGASLFFV